MTLGHARPRPSPSGTSGAWRAAVAEDRADYALEVEHQRPEYEAAAAIAAAAVKVGLEVTVEVPTMRPDPAALDTVDLRDRLEPAARVRDSVG